MRKYPVGSVSLQVTFAFAVFSLFLTIGCGSSSPSTKVTATSHPLVAKYDLPISGDAQAWVEFGLDTNYGKQTSSVPTPSGNSFSVVPVLVAGMKPDTTYHMRAHIKYANNDEWVDGDKTFTTGAVSMQNMVGLTTSHPSQAAGAASSLKGVELLNLVDLGTDALQSAVTDLDGNMVWFYNANISAGESALPVKPIGDGDWIADISNSQTGVFKLREIDLAGTTIRDIASTDLDQKLLSLGRSVTLNQFHHDILSLPNGHTILLANMEVPYDNLAGYPGTTNVIGDVLIDLDPNWNPVWYWSTFDHLDVNRHLQGLPDWTHSNAIVYTPNDGNLLLSMRHQGWVIKIDYANGSGTGDILWKLGEEGDFVLTGGDPSQWFYAQHYPNILNINGSQMTLSLIDNGNLRIVDSIGDKCGANVPCYSRAVVFNVDESARIAGIAWQDKPGLYSSWGGSIGEVDGTNVEYNLTAPFSSSGPLGFQAKSRVQEVTQDADQSVVWQLDIDGANAYRAYRIPSLYPGVTWNQ